LAPLATHFFDVKARIWSTRANVRFRIIDNIAPQHAIVTYIDKVFQVEWTPSFRIAQFRARPPASMTRSALAA